MQLLDIQPKTQEEIRDSLHTIAAKHAARTDILHLLPNDPDVYSGQDLTERVIVSDSVLTPGQVEAEAVEIDPRYSSLVKAYDTYCDPTGPTHSRFANVEAIALNGGHVIHGTDHNELLDTIFDHLHFANRLKVARLTRLPESDEDLEENRRKYDTRIGMVVSKMIDFLGVEYKGVIVPVRDVLSLGFDKVYLPIPNTATSKNKFEPGARSRYNRAVLGDIAADLRPARSNRKPMILGLALPGSVNKKEKYGDRNVIGQVSDGITIYTKLGVSVLSAVRMSQSESQVYIDDELHALRERKDITRALTRLAKAASDMDGVTYIYDQDGDIPVIEPERVA